jgi:hypothetical protein
MGNAMTKAAAGIGLAIALIVLSGCMPPAAPMVVEVPPPPPVVAAPVALVPAPPPSPMHHPVAAVRPPVHHHPCTIARCAVTRSAPARHCRVYPIAAAFGARAMSSM